MQVFLSDYVRGASFATDLVNSAPIVMTRTGDTLATPDALQDLLVEHHLHADTLAGRLHPTGRELASVHALRDRLRTILQAPTDADVAAQAGDLLAEANGHPLLCMHADHWQWCIQTPAGSGLADELAVLTGAGLLGSLRALGHDRFRACESATCNGVFVDTSRGGRRRYCMPDLCGNRVNVANYRARQRRHPTGK